MRARAATVMAAGAVALSACGGSGSPQYCSDRGQLEQSVRAVGDVNVTASGGLQDLKQRLQQVEGDANALVQSAKGDFPSETSAISSSVTTLKGAVQGLPSSPSPQQLAKVGADAKATVNAFQNFKKASDSKCS